MYGREILRADAYHPCVIHGLGLMLIEVIIGKKIALGERLLKKTAM